MTTVLMVRAAQRIAGAGVLAGAVVLAGCARVDPGPDYERARQYVERSTGAARLFDPRRRSEDAEIVRAALRDGLSADEAVQIALLNNPQLQAALYDVGVARANLVQTGLLSNPVLGVALRLPAGGGLANLDLDLAQNIADLWQIPARKRVVTRELARTILRVAQQAVETVAAVREAYWAALSAQRRYELAAQNLAVTREMLDLTRFRQQAGAGSELDVNLARGIVLEAERDLTLARLEADSALRAVASLLGLTSRARELTLTDDLPQPPKHTLDVAAALALAEQRRLDLQAVQQAVAAAQGALRLEYLRIFPTLEVGVAMERDARQRERGRKLLADTARSSIGAGRLAAPEIQPRSERRGSQRQDVITGPLISLELPLLDQNIAQIARARLLLEQQQRVYEGLSRQVTQQVREALDQAVTAWDVARFYRDQILPQAGASLAMARESYRAGKTSILTVLDAQRTWLAVQQQYVDALERAARAVPRLELAVGAPLEVILRPGPATRPAAAPASAQPSSPDAGRGQRSDEP